jgi:hypothetical protein
VGKQIAEGGLFECAVFAGVKDEDGVVAELGEGLAAGAAGHGSGVVEISYGNGTEANGGAVLGDGAGDGALFGAGGEAVGSVFDVAAGDDATVFEQQRCAYAEAGVRRVRVGGGLVGEVAEVVAFGGGEWSGLWQRRHGKSFRVDLRGRRCKGAEVAGEVRGGWVLTGDRGCWRMVGASNAREYGAGSRE